MSAEWFESGPAPAHHCSPPPVRTYGPARPKRHRHEITIPTLNTLPVGSRYGCSCGVVWIVHYVPPVTHGRTHMTGGNEWRREKPRERRKRLGIPVWKFWR